MPLASTKLRHREVRIFTILLCGFVEIVSVVFSHVIEFCGWPCNVHERVLSTNRARACNIRRYGAIRGGVSHSARDENGPKAEKITRDRFSNSRELLKRSRRGRINCSFRRFQCTASCEKDGLRYRILQCVWYGTNKPAGTACRDQPRPPVMKTCTGPPCPPSKNAYCTSAFSIIRNTYHGGRRMIVREKCTRVL